MSSMFGQNVSTRILILKRHRAIQFGSVKAYLKGKGLTSGWRASLQIKKRFCFSLQTPLISFDGQELPVSLKLKNFKFRWKRSILVWTERQFFRNTIVRNFAHIAKPKLQKKFQSLSWKRERLNFNIHTSKNRELSSHFWRDESRLEKY